MSSLPNSLTISRIALVPLFVAAFFLPEEPGRWIVFLLFCLAGLTDAVDGMIARKLKAESSLGRMLDPIADKLIVSAALLMLTADRTLQGIHLVPALVILCREILVSGLREFLAGAKVSVPVTIFAKFKTALQMIAIGAMILTPLADEYLPDAAALSYSAFAYGLLWIAAALTVYTGWIYFRAGLRHLHPRGAS
jgi:CDP-diacylglycerol--glycerol-3-phosphate 3-phosphatidyltransferase